MGSATVLVSREEYLESSYRPDRDWIDGEVKERNVGERPHATIQGFLIYQFRLNERAWKTYVLPEQRVQVSPQRYRVSDVCVVRDSDPDEPIVHTPPLLCVEILSRDDRMSDIYERVDDYLQMGVETVWIIDPRRRRAYEAQQGRTKEASEALTASGTPIIVSVADMFAELDRVQARKP